MIVFWAHFVTQNGDLSRQWVLDSKVLFQTSRNWSAYVEQEFEKGQLPLSRKGFSDVVFLSTPPW